MLPYSTHTVLNKVFVSVPIPDASLGTFSISSLLDSWLGLLTPPTPPWPPAGWDAEVIICWLQHFSGSTVEFFGGSCQLPLPYFEQHLGVKCCTELDTISCRTGAQRHNIKIIIYWHIPVHIAHFSYTTYIYRCKRSQVRSKLACLRFLFPDGKIFFLAFTVTQGIMGPVPSSIFASCSRMLSQLCYCSALLGSN